FYLIGAALLTGVYIARRMADSKIGRTYRAVREDELAAGAMGVNVNLYKISAFVVSAAYAGVAGALFGSFAGVASPDNFTFDDSVGFLCMSVVGGNCTVAGAVAGALALTVLSEVLRVFQGFRLIIYGTILIFTVIFMPTGLAGFFEGLRARFRRRKEESLP
ncbi:MAG: branched-chain amino acid ABC transporter permease, partial [Synergistaceae bacterium]|nr:branched-chain amino acid ABC transporter permease [Synergistaceae bacterium]